MSCGSASFKRECRLIDKAAFNRVFKKAKRSRDPLFTVLYRHRENNHDKVARVGLAISKRHCKQSAGRNRIKRQVRESFRHHKCELAGLDIVVMNQPDAANASNRELTTSLANHWRRCCRNQANEPGSS